MNLKVTIFLLLILCFSTNFALAQREKEKDAALWGNVYIEKRFDKKNNIHLNQQYRINNNISELGLFYFDLGVTHKFSKKIKVLFDYVYANKRDKRNEFFTNHQAYTAIVLKQEWARWNISYRNMIQADMDATKENFRTNFIPFLYERNKLTIKYTLNKYLCLYNANEIYLPLNDYKKTSFDRFRTFTGLFYALNRNQEVELYFMIQRQLNAPKVTKQYYIYGVGYSIVLR